MFCAVLRVFIKQLKCPFPSPEQGVCGWGSEAKTGGTTSSCTTSQTRSGRRILGSHVSHLWHYAPWWRGTWHLVRLRSEPQYRWQPCVIRHYVICTSLHMRRTIWFHFQPDEVFICPLHRIRKGLNHPLRSEWNFNRFWPIHSDWRVYMWLFRSDCASSPITIGLLVSM